jgi:hypothetical protein
MKTKLSIIIFIMTAIMTACTGSVENADLDSTPTANPSGISLEDISIATPITLEEDAKTAYHEDFNQEKTVVSEDWGAKVVSGNLEQMIWAVEEGNMNVAMQAMNSPIIYFMHKDEVVENGIIQIDFENSGAIDMDVAVVCRATNAGWYEFRISPRGTFEVYRYDKELADAGQNAYDNLGIARTYTEQLADTTGMLQASISCIDEEITFFINGKQVMVNGRPFVVQDDTFSAGSIGFGVISAGEYVEVDIDSIEVLKP